MERDFDKPVAAVGFTVPRASLDPAASTKYVKEVVVLTEAGGVYAFNEEQPDWVPLPAVPGTLIHAMLMARQEEAGE